MVAARAPDSQRISVISCPHPTGCSPSIQAGNKQGKQRHWAGIATVKLLSFTWLKLLDNAQNLVVFFMASKVQKFLTLLFLKENKIKIYWVTTQESCCCCCGCSCSCCSFYYWSKNLTLKFGQNLVNKGYIVTVKFRNGKPAYPKYFCCWAWKYASQYFTVKTT